MRNTNYGAAIATCARAGNSSFKLNRVVFAHLLKFLGMQVAFQCCCHCIRGQPVLRSARLGTSVVQECSPLASLWQTLLLEVSSCARFSQLAVWAPRV